MSGVALRAESPPATARPVQSRWALSPLVAIRPEAFGALLYHSGTRRLTAVRDQRLAQLLGLLQSPPTGGIDLAAAFRAAGIGDAEQAGYQRVLDGLARHDTIRPARTVDGTAVGRATAVDAEDGATAADQGDTAQSRPDGRLRSEPLPRSSHPTPRTALLQTGDGARPQAGESRTIADECEVGMSAPICLTWEITYGCQLACRHCLSSSGRRDPRELDTAQCLTLVDEMRAMGVFYVNVGGGEPTLRSDFWDILHYAVDSRIGVKFSTNGYGITKARAAELAATPYVDVQVSMDGADATVNDAVRGHGSYRLATGALAGLAEAGFPQPKLSVVVTRHNITQLDEFSALADRYGAVLRLTRLRPSGRGVNSWDDLHPTRDQLRDLHSWLLAKGESVLTGDSFFHLSAFGAALPGMNVCGAGRVVCLVDPVGDVYACPFAIDDAFLAGSVLDPGGFAGVWRDSPTFTRMRRPSAAAGCAGCDHQTVCRGGCPAAKHFTGLPADGPDPECVTGRADESLAARAAGGRASLPVIRTDHSHPAPRVTPPRPPVHPCNDNPLATTTQARQA